MNLELGKSIMTSDGRQAGTVDQFVVDPQTRTLVAIISREGFIFTEDRIIEADHIDRVDDDGTIHLNLPEDKVEDLPLLASARFQMPERDDDYYSAGLDRGNYVGATGVGHVYVGANSGYSPIAPAPDSLFAPADPDPAPIRDVSNIGDSRVMIDEGTDVVDINGKKIGEVDEIKFSEDEVVGFVVEAGFLFRHKVRVPTEWIESVTNEAVRLNRVADEVEREGRVDE